MIWQTDAFALATGFDSNTGRYVGLWLPADKNSAPTPTDSLLLVRPDVAEKQREKDSNTVIVEPPIGGGTTTPVAGDEPKVVPVEVSPSKTRFFGVKTISSDKIALDFKNISDEILANLRRPGVSLVVRVEIEASNSTGFEESTVRTVSENAKTLKFDQSGFESS